MSISEVAAEALRGARAQAGLSQRELAKKARTAQSVVARIELGETSPSMDTLTRLLKAAGFDIAVDIRRMSIVDRSILEDVPRILRMSPEDRLREVAQVSRFLTAARRA